MRTLLLLSFIFLFSTQLKSQNLDKIRVLCIDEVNISQYQGQLSNKQLESQIAELGFTFIENGEVKYHDDLIVYDCNTGDVKFTAVFDENRLVKEFVLYESQDQPAKKILFSNSNKSQYVDLVFNYKGQNIPAYPTGKTEIFDGAKLKQTIVFSEDGSLPIITNYDRSLKKVSEGKASIRGEIKGDWELKKIGEWKYFQDRKLASISTYGENGNENSKQIFSNGVLAEKRAFSSNGTVALSKYHPNGTITQSGTQDGDTKIGTWKYFDLKGNLDEQIEYVNGQENEILVFDENENIIKRTELVEDKSELSQSLNGLSTVYKYQSFYPNQELKSEGYQSNGKEVGVFLSYNENGTLREITEYDLNSKKINSIDAETYSLMKTKEKEIFRELLVLRTTHPENLSLLSNIKTLAKSLNFDFDSLMNYEYKKQYQQKFASLKDQTSSFGNLSNELIWYDSLVASSQDFNNQVWEYYNELIEKELVLEKELAIKEIDTKLSVLTENNTSIKSTLFGQKIEVKNDQDEIYEFVAEELYPVMNTEISTAQSKYEVESALNDFNRLMKKASSIISNPDEKFQQSLQDMESIQDKKQLFLTVK